MTAAVQHLARGDVFFSIGSAHAICKARHTRALIRVGWHRTVRIGLNARCTILAGVASALVHVDATAIVDP